MDRVLSLDEVQMSQNRRNSKVGVQSMRTRPDVQASVPKQEHNHPVDLEEFERERMGIASKE
jgi:hypothetical protein